MPNNLLDSFTIDFEQLTKDKIRVAVGLLQAQRGAVTDVGREAEKALESATASAGLGKLAKVWASRVYPQRGLANDPVAVIYPKGEQWKRVIRGQTQGGQIRARSGSLAIPTPAAQIGSNKRPTPEEWERVRGIKLITVERPGKPTLLIAAGVAVSAKGRIRAASATAIQRGRFASAVIFILMPAVSLRSRFSVSGVLASYPSRLKEEFERRAGAL